MKPWHIHLGLVFVAKYYFLNLCSTTSLLVHWCWTLTRVYMYTWYVNNNWYVCVHVGREADWSEVAGTVGRGQTAFLWGVWGGEGRLCGAGQTLQEFTSLQEMDGGKATRCGVTHIHRFILIHTVWLSNTEICSHPWKFSPQNFRHATPIYVICLLTFHESFHYEMFNLLWKFSPQNAPFLRICETFLPQKFPL